MKLLKSKFFPIILSIFLVVAFFWQFFFKGLLPIPADTIVGLYHPFRDLYTADYPNGIPYKNFLITDPVRQQYPWKKLSIDAFKNGELPLWNPYEMAGKPLLGNFQSGAFYPLNLIFFVLPFNIAWSLFIIIQPLFLLVFTYFFLKNLNVSKFGSLFGGSVFAFSGFSIAWLEWGNILNTAIWLPIILLSIDKLIKDEKEKKYLIILTASFIFSFFAGHLQTFFYLFITSFAYFLFRWLNAKNLRKFLTFAGAVLLFGLLTLVQSIPTLKFISESSRSFDQIWLANEGWFIPWQNIIQFVAPDFFGNPATLNYWGIWNYAEFLGYIGILPIILALFALFFKRDRNILFFGLVFFLSMIFAFPTFLAKIPYIFNIPLISTAQPTRLIFLIDFSLAVLSSFGLDYLIKNKKGIFYPIGFIGLTFLALWVIVIKSTELNLLISRQNLIFPTAVFVLVVFLIFVLTKIKGSRIIIYLLFALTIADLFRFGWKFTPFTDQKYLFPESKILSFLQRQKDQFRLMSVDSRILAPNFSTVYKIQSIEGYDPLYLERYAEIIAASERGEKNINPPFGFGRIITPKRIESEIINLLGVRFILSLSDLDSPKLSKIQQEGQTRLYENKTAFTRAFFVEKTIAAKDKNESIDLLFSNKENLVSVGIVEEFKNSNWSKGKAVVSEYKNNKVLIKTENEGDGFLILTDSFYPTWRAKLDGTETKIYRTDFNFRGVIVPKGLHTIEFYITLL